MIIKKDKKDKKRWPQNIENNSKYYWYFYYYWVLFLSYKYIMENNRIMYIIKYWISFL